MTLKECPRCKRLFQRIRSPVCDKCQAEEDADYDKIRAVLDRSPNSNAEEVSAEAQVTVECVLRMLDDGLISSVNLIKDVKCGRCGAPAISASKKLCKACLDKLNAEVAAAQGKIRLGQKKSVRVCDRLHARRAFEEKKRS